MGKLNYRIPNTNDFREIYVKVTDTLPIGAVCQYGGSTAPSGYLMCNGQAVSRTTYADLFKAIGTSFGSGDGVTTFNVPNFNGRVPVGLDGTDTDFDTIGKIGGSKELQEHKHSLYWGSTSGGSGDSIMMGADRSGTTSAQMLNAGTGDSGNLQPYIVTNFIIKASKKVALDKGNVVDSLDGSDTDSAPSVRAVNEALVDTYSTNEVKTNKIWFGKPVYRKVLELTNVPRGYQVYDHNIDNFGDLTDIYGTFKENVTQNPITKIAADNLSTFSMGVMDINATQIHTLLGSEIPTTNTMKIVLEYTKTTD